MRADRNRYLTEPANNMEAAAHFGNFGKLFRLIPRASGKQLTPEPNLRDASGHLISDLDEKIDRWATYFQQLLNHVLSNRTTTTALLRLKRKSVNPSATSKVGNLQRMMQFQQKYATCANQYSSNLFTAIWETEIFPYDWGTSILLPTPKKGDKSICDNYRGIIFIYAAAEISTVLVLNRFSVI